MIYVIYASYLVKDGKKTGTAPFNSIPRALRSDDVYRYKINVIGNFDTWGELLFIERNQNEEELFVYALFFYLQTSDMFAQI